MLHGGRALKVTFDTSVGEQRERWDRSCRYRASPGKQADRAFYHGTRATPSALAVGNGAVRSTAQVGIQGRRVAVLRLATCTTKDTVV
jgi:hypothetical protein